MKDLKDGTQFGQDTYKDSNGKDISARMIDTIAPYTHIADGFYKWKCTTCTQEHSSRSCGWPIAGQVLECDGCHKMNLLVKTNCTELDEAFGAKLQAGELNRELNFKIKELDRYVSRAELGKIAEDLDTLGNLALRLCQRIGETMHRSKDIGEA